MLPRVSARETDLDSTRGAMTCREASNLLPLFFDGELDARQMRVIALQSFSGLIRYGDMYKNLKL